jgi:heme exporter protein C
LWGAFALGFNTRLSAMMAQAIAPTGALMTFIALWTGSLWGRPTWGTYWAWDARMTSELILLFLYLGIIALRNAIDDPRRADRACAVLSLVGAVNVPIIYFSVRWWNTLHQGSSVSLTAAPKMAGMASRNEYRAASSRASPRTKPALIVVPERDRPGIIARA